MRVTHGAHRNETTNITARRRSALSRNVPCSGEDREPSCDRAAGRFKSAKEIPNWIDWLRDLLCGVA